MPDVDPAAPSLGRRTLTHAHSDVSLPSYDARDLQPGVVHLGLGSFARAHQAVYLDRLAESGVSRGWGLVGCGLRSASAAEALAAQDNLWTVVEGRGATPRVVGVLQRYVDASRSPAELLRVLCDPRVRLVTMTITAPAYELTTSRGAGWATFSLVAEALHRRRTSGAGPFTVLSCDNLPDGGAAARTAVLAAAEAIDPVTARWVERTVSFPGTMADRITPSTTDVQRQSLRRRSGLLDRIPLFPEAFSQWVVSDDFCAGRPPLEEVGVQLVSDVRPYVEVKSRLLNATHVALGFLGARLGHRTSVEAMRDPRISTLVQRLLTDEVVPSLGHRPGIDVDGYRRAVLARVTDESVPDSLDRLCLRGSLRVRNYVLPSVAGALAAGTPYQLLTEVVAGWVVHLRGAADGPGGVDALADPLAAHLVPLARAADTDPRPLLRTVEVFGELGHDRRFVRAFRDALVRLQGEGSAVAS